MAVRADIGKDGVGTRLMRGVFVRREDAGGCEVATVFDIRMKVPGREAGLSRGAAKAIARLGTMYYRADAQRRAKFISFVQARGRDSFNLAVRGRLTSLDILEEVKGMFKFIAVSDGQALRSTSVSIFALGKRELDAAKKEAAKFLREVLDGASVANLVYPARPQSYWQSVGYRLVGPLLVAFSRWLKDAASSRGVKRLYFLARDGEVMMKVFTALYPEKAGDCRYLLASRRLCMNEACREDFTAYLRAEGLDEEGCAVVDVGRNGTIPRSLAKLLGRETIATFYLDQRVQDDFLFGYIPPHHAPKDERRMLDILDFLLVSPTSLTIGIRREGGAFVPETLDVTPDERVRQGIAQALQAGAEECALAMRPLLEKLPPPTIEAAIAALSRFRLLTRADRAAMANVTVPFGMENEKHRYLVTPAWPWHQRLVHFGEFFNGWRKRLLP